MPSLYTILVDPEYEEMCNDIMHKWILLSVYQLLSSVTAGADFLSDTFVDGMCFLTIGIVAYWILFRKVLTITSDDTDVTVQ